MASSVALLVKEEDLEKIRAHYASFSSPSEDPSVSFLTSGEDYSLRIYSKAHNGAHKVLFQGKGAQREAVKWEGLSLEPVLFKLPRKPIILKKEGLCPGNKFPQIGSDEVGTGDFFGPVVVVAAYVKESDLPRLKELGVTDSKKMSDEHILKIGPILAKEFPYSALILDNARYNKAISSGENMASVKAKMHNRCLLNLKAKFPEAKPYQDQFAEPSLYYSYLKRESEVLEGITFKTKGELAFPSVALASVLARYAFLEKMQKIEERYSFSFPFGAGELVDEKASGFVAEFGMEELKNVAKMNFANVSRVKG